MLAHHSTRERSRSPHNANGSNSPSPLIVLSSSNIDEPSTSIDSNDQNSTKIKKDNESQQRQKSLKTFIQNLINDSNGIGSNYDEQMKFIEKACLEEFSDQPIDRIRRMIRSLLKLRKSHSSTSLNHSLLHQDHKNILPNNVERFNSVETSNKKSRSSISSTKTTDLIRTPVSTLSALDADFLRHAFSQQFRPSLDISSYFSTNSNGTNGPVSPLFRPNFSPSTFLQSLTNAAPLPPPLVSTHSNTNGTADSSLININKTSKTNKLTSAEASSIRVLINAYREAASYLTRSADELEHLI